MGEIERVCRVEKTIEGKRECVEERERGKTEKRRLDELCEE